MINPTGGGVPRKRDIAVSIILTIVTCGIYDLVWDYQIGQDIREHTQHWEINPGLDIFFMIITCNIYYFFWLYKMAQLLQDQERECFPDQPPSISPGLLVVLALIGATVVSDAVFQHEMNRHWERHSA